MTNDEDRQDSAGFHPSLEAVLQHIPEGVIVAESPDVVIRLASDRGFAISGRPRADLTDIPAERHAEAWAVYHADGATPARPEELPLTRATRHGELIQDEEWALRRPDGAIVPILCNAGPLRDDSGRLVGGILAYRDISALKDVEAELRRAKEAAERASAMKNRLVAASGHDMKQPLQVLSLLVSRLRLGSGRPPEPRLVDAAERSIERLTRALDQLMEAARLDDAPTAEPAPTPIAPLLAQVAATVKDAAARKGIAVRVCATEAVALTDLHLLWLVLANLVQNAVKFTSSGGVLIGCRPCQGALRIDVHDTGCGVCDRDLPLIFEEFRQLDETTEGLGLGLAIARRAAALLGHPLHVRSTPGRGSRFSIILPRA